MTKFTPKELAEIDRMPEALTLTKRILRVSYNKALTAKQLAELLNVSQKTIFKMAKAGRMPSFRVGTAVRFDPKHITDWLRQQRRD